MPPTEGFRLREGDRVRIDLQLPDVPLQVDAAEDRLTQVFENLLDNALSFSAPGGTIREWRRWLRRR